MSQYAQATSVTSEASRREIEKTLSRFGADQFMYGIRSDMAAIGFVMRGRQMRFVLHLPDEQEFARTPTGRARSQIQMQKEREQAIRRLWRSLSLAIKAKLVAVEDGILTFEEEFGMHMVMPDGQTVAEHVIPRIESAYESGQVPALLPDHHLAIEGER